MSKPILQVEGLSKRFWIGAQGDRGARYVVEKAFRNPLSIFKSPKKKEFWALQDINFTLHDGDTLALIGRNGAGKSTLLKLISRITLPTQGRLVLNGRVGSLLEVGTGFHPELTGRENIFLNGALLGMRRAEIVKNFDAIVDFAEVSEFLDTPVKRYSSGMYVRLAFAIAAHLQTELLIVDEVLAVGDQRFQKKCLEKMDEVGRAGRTIIFVSHNPALLQSLCKRAILLDGGRLLQDGPLEAVLDTYQNRATLHQTDQGVQLAGIPRGKGMHPYIHSLQLLDAHGRPASIFQIATPIHIVSRCNIDMGAQKLAMSISLTPVHGSQPAFTLSSTIENTPLASSQPSFAIRTTFILPALLPGQYALSLQLKRDGNIVDEVPFAGVLEVAPHNFYTTGRLGNPADGTILVRSQWSLQ